MADLDQQKQQIREILESDYELIKHERSISTEMDAEFDGYFQDRIDAILAIFTREGQQPK